MKKAIIGCAACLLTVSACCHAPPAPSVEWNREIPPLCPVSDPHLGPADRPGVYVLQIVSDTKNLDNSIAFVIFVAHGEATVQNLIGPIGTGDWKKFYNDLGVLGSARPGGFYCDGVVDETGTKEMKFEPGQRPHYEPPDKDKDKPDKRCPGNPHAFLRLPQGERLASGPVPPGPPPPDVTGFVQVVDEQAFTMLGLPVPARVQYASNGPTTFVGDPTGCEPLERKAPQLKAILGTYVQRAIDAVNVLGPRLK